MTITLQKPSSSVKGIIQLPGSKSLANRVLMIRAISGLSFDILHLSDSDDTRHLSDALSLVKQHGYVKMDIGHAGTDMRFMTAFLAMQNGEYELTGSERLQQRPIKELVSVLRTLGADISYLRKDGYPPLHIKGVQITGGEARIKGNVSSQFITALLLVAPYFRNGLKLTIEGDIVSKPYIDMTIGLMKEFGAEVIWANQEILVKPVPYTYALKSYTIESDWSAASYFYSIMASSNPGAEVTLEGLFQKSFQADAICCSLFKGFGVETEFSGTSVRLIKKPVVKPQAFQYDFIECPDIAQTMACTCAGLSVPFSFTGLQTLKVKETDRILALQVELEKFNCKIKVTDHSMTWDGSGTESKKIPTVKTYNDHRMAMAFAPLCFVTDQLLVEDAQVVSKSYPQFWKHLEQLGFVVAEFNS